jgi:16S rRNA (uracil1498-N3)-methyltransferase
MARRIRAPIAGLAAGQRTLDSEVSHYLARVLRLREGDSFVAFDPVTRMESSATMVDAKADAVTVTFASLVPAGVVAATPLVLVYSLAKGDKVDAVVRDATELGATGIIIASTARSVVKVKTGDAKVDRWKRIAEQAARQCGRGDGPSIHGVHAWTDALELAMSCDARFCLDPQATMPLGPALAAATAQRASIAFAVGPEGGLTKQEIEQACERRFAAVSLGRIVLRTETVGAAILGAVRVLMES